MENKHTTDIPKTKRGPFKERDGRTPSLTQPKKPRYVYVIEYFALDEYIRTYICSSKTKALILAKDLKQSKDEQIFIEKIFINLNKAEFITDI